MKSSVTPFYRSIKDLLQNRSFSIDEYQREYKWEKKQIEELLTDLIGKFRSSYQIGDDTKAVAEYEEYFLGSIIVTVRGAKNYIVDGQQRITSLTLLLIHLYRIAEEKEWPVKSTMAPLIYSDNLGSPAFNLDIRERLSVLETLFYGKDIPKDTDDESIENMYARYEDIETADLEDELGKALQHFIYWLMIKVGLIEIVATSDNQAYSIFETMNDRGKPLSPVDMMKAYLLAPIEDAEDRKLINAAWKKEMHDLLTWGEEVDNERDASFFKAWFRAQHAISIRERKVRSTDKDWELIGGTFHRWARDNEERLGLGSEEGHKRFMSVALPFFAKAYKLVLEASSKYTPGLEHIFYNAQNGFTWQSTVLMAALDVEDDMATVKTKLSLVARYLDIWIMQRVVNYMRISYSGSSYAMYLLCKEIRRKPLSELGQILFDRLEEDETSFEQAKNGRRQGLENLRLNQFSKRYIFHLLARVTSFVEAKSGRQDRFEEYVDRDRKNSYDIEHITPDMYDRFTEIFKSESEFDDFRNDVAALLLLPADVNRSLQDRDYAHKVKIYEGQNLYAASLAEGPYAHQPQFRNFREEHQLKFGPHEAFLVEDLESRKELLKKIVPMIWDRSSLLNKVRDLAVHQSSGDV